MSMVRRIIISRLECTVRHERRQFVAQVAASPAEAVDFSGGFIGLYSERR